MKEGAPPLQPNLQEQLAERGFNVQYFQGRTGFGEAELSTYVKWGSFEGQLWEALIPPSEGQAGCPLGPMVEAAYAVDGRVEDSVQKINKVLAADDQPGIELSQETTQRESLKQQQTVQAPEQPAKPETKAEEPKLPEPARPAVHELVKKAVDDEPASVAPQVTPQQIEQQLMSGLTEDQPITVLKPESPGLDQSKPEPITQENQVLAQPEAIVISPGEPELEVIETRAVEPDSAVEPAEAVNPDVETIQTEPEETYEIVTDSADTANLSHEVAEFRAEPEAIAVETILTKIVDEKVAILLQSTPEITQQLAVFLETAEPAVAHETAELIVSITDLADHLNDLYLAGEVDQHNHQAILRQKYEELLVLIGFEADQDQIDKLFSQLMLRIESTDYNLVLPESLEEQDPMHEKMRDVVSRLINNIQTRRQRWSIRLASIALQATTI